MQIEVEFIGFPMIYDIFPEGRHRVSFEGQTLHELIEHLMARNGERLKAAFMEPGSDRFDPTIQVSLNKRFLARQEIPQADVGDGDCVTFLRLLAGG
jgi:sulfur carrier protein ThiS